MTMTHKEALGAAVVAFEAWSCGPDGMDRAIRRYCKARGLVLVPRDEVTDEMIAAHDKADWAKRCDMMSPHPTEEYNAGGGAAIAAAPDPFTQEERE